MTYPVTPDGRYFVVRGRLWRTTNPDLPAAARKVARAEVERTKRAQGERGPVWWADGAPDHNRHMAKNTPYRQWFEALPEG